MSDDNEGNISWRDWFLALDDDLSTLRQVLDASAHLKASQDDIPIVIQLVENPKFDIPGIDLFSGAVDLQTHDCIHIILGRGMLPKDEAFVIGFTMGSTNRVSQTEEWLFGLASKYLYPGPYKFTKDDIAVFKDAVRLGFISDCMPLSEIDYGQYMDMPLKEVRRRLGIEVELLKAYYGIEHRRYPEDKASQRLLAH
jgi:hypothetical protein